MSPEVASVIELGKTYLCPNCEALTNSAVCPVCGQTLSWLFKNLKAFDEVSRKIRTVLNSKDVLTRSDHKHGDCTIHPQDLNDRWG